MGTPPQPPASPAAGWYADPQSPGQLRYWDGTQWTQQRAAGGGSPGGAPVGGPGKSTKPWWQRTWVLVTGGILALIIIASAASSGGGGGSDDEGEQANSGGATTGERQEEPQRRERPEQPKSCGTTASSDCTPHVGPRGTIRVDAIYWNVLGARTTRTLGNQEFGTGARADGIFVVVQVRGRSDKDESATLTDETFKLTYRDGPEFSVDTEGSTAALLAGGNSASEPFFLRELQPDTATTGTLVFDVPPAALRRPLEVRFNELGFGEGHGFIRLPPVR